MNERNDVETPNGYGTASIEKMDKGFRVSAPDFEVKDGSVFISDAAISVLSVQASQAAFNVAALAAQMDDALSRIEAIERRLP